MQNTRNTRPAMLQPTTETLPDTCPEGIQTTVNMPPVMEQTSQLRCTQEQPNIAEVNLTPGDNNTAEQSNKYSADMLVDTTDHPIMKDMWNTRVFRHRNYPITVPDKRENDNILREKREPHKHRHEERTDWAETLLSPLMMKYSYQHRRKDRNWTKNYEKKGNCWHIVNEHKAKRARQHNRNYNPYITTTRSTIHDSRIQSSYAKY